MDDNESLGIIPSAYWSCNALGWQTSVWNPRSRFHHRWHHTSLCPKIGRWASHQFLEGTSAGHGSICRYYQSWTLFEILRSHEAPDCHHSRRQCQLECHPLHLPNAADLPEGAAWPEKYLVCIVRYLRNCYGEEGSSLPETYGNITNN